MIRNHHSMLWAIGEDRPGIVASITKILFAANCNIEESSMMRLGGQFGVFLTFARSSPLLPSLRGKLVTSIRRSCKLNADILPLSQRAAAFVPPSGNTFMITVHGPDRPGIVYRVTQVLARNKFNITDLSTHRTTNRSASGFILFIEGEATPARARTVTRSLNALARTLRTKITVSSLEPHAL